MSEFNLSKIFDFLLTIPKGKVVTYGIIAVWLGNAGLARAVGNALHKNPNPNLYPCYKVVNFKGELSKNFAFGGIEAQKALLEAEGIKVTNYAVDLKKYLITSF